MPRSDAGRPRTRFVVDGRLSCGRCKKMQPVSMYYKAKTACGYASTCYDCIVEKRPDALERAWRYHLKTRYGLTVEQYDAMFEAQGGLCACCGRPETRQKIAGDSEVARLCVDHDHRCCPGDRSCGKCVRALLCTSCNLLVGHVEATPMLVLPILDYLDRFGRGPLEGVDVLGMLGGP